ncbi:MAG TPA: endonuclease/exonuclease/phosphatase family protein [Myxococcales bacterium]|jgi:endonuclease/exonuclease/phosphatase family metal-dependent hydrolase
MSPAPAPIPARHLTLLASSLGIAALAIGLAACPTVAPCEVSCGQGCCAANETCSSDFTCQCAPSCDGKGCGEDDGCGNACNDPCTQGDTGPGRDAGKPDAGRADVGTPDTGPKVDAGPVGAPVAFKVMDWNVHDFFDENDDPAKNDTVVSATSVTSKIAKLAKVINAQAPDIVTLQEVETEDLLRRLNDKLTVKLPNYKLIPGRDPRGINVAILSKFPLLLTKTHQNEWLYTPDGRGPYKWSRDCLEAHVDLGGNREAAFLVNHFISQVDDNVDTDLKRQAQAKAARDLADGIRNSTPWVAVIITGDMNDDPGSASTRLFFDDGMYVDFWAGQSASAAWTYKDGSTPHRLDYLIPDKTTAGWKQSATLVHSMDVTAASDHSPVTASFTYP